MRKMKKLIVWALTMAMLVSMFGVAGAEDQYNGFGERIVPVVDEHVILAQESPANGTIGAISFNEALNDDMYLRLTVEASDDEHNGYGFGALCSSDWQTNVISVNCGTSAEPAVQEWSYSELLSAYEAQGLDATAGVVLNDWGDYAAVSKLEIVYRGGASELVLGTTSNADGINGTLSILKGYSFTEENVSLKLTIETTTEGKENNGFGALNNSDWKNVITLNAGVVGEATSSWTLKEIGTAYTDAGYDATAGVVINDWGDYAAVTKAEVIATLSDPEGALRVGVVYKQTTEVVDGVYNVRFVQLIKEETAAETTSVTYTFDNGTTTMDREKKWKYSRITVVGEAIAAPEGYVFIGYAITNVPEDIALTCTMTLNPIR